jgi:hypothetical protein
MEQITIVLGFVLMATLELIVEQHQLYQFDDEEFLEALHGKI